MAEKTPIKEQIKVLTEQIETGIQALFQSGDLEKYQAYLRTASRFHRYSVNNQMLIFSQCPHATLVAGYQKWQNQFSRHVLRGEKGITIIAPTPYKIKVEQDKLDPDTKQPLLDADGKTITEEKEVQIPMFRPVKVFDVSQTDGKPLPEQVKSPIAELTGNVEHYEAFMDALKRVSPVPIEMKPLTNDLDGFFSPSKQSITLREGMSEVQTVCAAVHEIAHSKLHNYAMQPDSQPKDSSTEEIEAESIAYTVCAYFGIETSANSFGYVATWSKDKDLKAFKESLDTIRKTSSELISGVEQQFKEICKERGISLEPEQPAQEQDAEKLYMVDNEKYIHVQRTDGGIDYTIYDAGSAKALDGGVLEDSGQPLSAAALTVCKLHNIGDAAPIRLAPLVILENLQEANKITPCAAEEAPPDTPLPETPEIVHDAQETAPALAVPPDPSVSIAAMHAFGYIDADMLPLSKERALELMEHDATVYMLFAENSEAMAFEPEDIAMHTGLFGITARGLGCDQGICSGHGQRQRPEKAGAGVSGKPHGQLCNLPAQARRRTDGASLFGYGIAEKKRFDGRKSKLRPHLHRHAAAGEACAVHAGRSVCYLQSEQPRGFLRSQPVRQRHCCHQALRHGILSLPR